MIVYMVISERAEEEESNMHVDEIRIFSKLDDAKAFAKRKFEDVLKIFDVTKDDVRVEEMEKRKFGRRIFYPCKLPISL